MPPQSYSIFIFISELCSRFCLSKATYDKNVVDINLEILGFSSQCLYFMSQDASSLPVSMQKAIYSWGFISNAILLHDTFLNYIFTSLLLRVIYFINWILYLEIILLLDACIHGVIKGWLTFLVHLSFLNSHCFHSALKLASIFYPLASLFSFLFHLPNISQCCKVTTTFGPFLSSS